MEKKKLDLSAPNIIGAPKPVAKKENPTGTVVSSESLPSSDPRMAPNKPVGVPAKSRSKKPRQSYDSDMYFQPQNEADPEYGTSVRKATTSGLPVPTSSNKKNVGPHARTVRQRAGGVGDDEYTHKSLLESISSAPEHEVESRKAQLFTHISKKGYSHGLATACSGQGCRGTIPYESDQDYCGGSTCKTASSKVNVSRPSTANQQAESNLPH